MRSNSKFHPALRIFWLVFIVLTIELSPNILLAQTITKDQILQELNTRGVDAEELRLRLLEKDIDMDGIEELSPEEALQLKGVVEQTIAEMQSENSVKELIAVPDNPSISAKEDSIIIPDNAEDPDSVIPIQDPLLPIYGQEIFKGQQIKIYQKTTDVKVPPSYVLGDGDEITVSIWGLSTLDQTYNINANGFISPDKMPRIYLRGYRIERAKKILKNRFAQYYQFNPNEFDVALNTSRSIQVNIFGEVMHYGGFTLAATNTAFNAIVAAGGPTSLGSVRNITLIRGKQRKTLDVYKWMKNPSISEDFYLEQNDFIQIPKAERVVSIYGQIARPMQYELLQNEHLKALIEYAGGLTPKAYLKTIKIKRYQGQQQILLDVPWEELMSTAGDFVLQKGDIINIDSIQIFGDNTLTVEGAVEYPGNYAWRSNQKLKDLLSLLVFKPESNMKLGFIQRVNLDGTFKYIRVALREVMASENATDNILLQKGDKLIVLGSPNNDNKSTIEIAGAVNVPTILPYDQSRQLRISDLILFGGGLTEDALPYGYIERNDPTEYGSKMYIRVNIQQVIADALSKSNIILAPYDKLIVDSKNMFIEQSYYEVFGAVKKSGRYDYLKNISLKEALLLSGGLKMSAAAYRIDIYSIQFIDNKPTKTITSTVAIDRDMNPQTGNPVIIQPYDQIVVRYMPEFEFQKLVTVRGTVKYPGPYALTSPNEKLTSIIRKAGGLTREAFPEGSTLYREEDSLGYVIIDLSKAMQNESAKDNIILKAKDRIFIPKQKDLVGIEGATNASDLYYDEILASNKRINVPFHKGKNAMHYIHQFAAGVSKAGNKDYITVRHSNGKIVYTRNYILFRHYPKVQKGSVIQVGYKKKKKPKEKRERKEVDWGNVSRAVATQITTMLGIVALALSITR